MPDLLALRDAYRANKAQLLASMQAKGTSVRGIRKLLQALARNADETLRLLWAHAGMPPRFALLAVGGYGRCELFP
jgi:[protein-PII] uridylyltransferase